MSDNARVLAERVREELANRLPSMSPFNVGAAPDGGIMVSCGAAAPGGKNAIVIFKTEPNALSAAGGESFGPTVCQLVTEVDALGPGEILPLLIPLVHAGTRIDWYETPKGQAPKPDAVAGKRVAWGYPSLYGSVR